MRTIMGWLAKVKATLEWMRLAKFAADLIVAIASWKAAKKLLTYIPQISEDWASVIALSAAALILFALIWWQQLPRKSGQTTPDTLTASPNEIIKLQVTTLDPRSTDPKTVYKAKLRLTFTNQSKDVIEVGEPTWTTGRWDVPVQHPFKVLYQTERSLGSWRRNEWNSQELPQAHINPGQSFRMYVGLSDSVPHDDLESRRNGRRLGTLMIPAKIGNHTYKWEERV
jgi:hypothetical protein